MIQNRALSPISVARIGVSFSPDELEGLSLWLDADVGITLNGSTVAAWADRQGNTDVAQGVASRQPTYLGAGNGMSFDGVDDRLQSSVVLSTLAYLHQAATVFIACDRTDSTKNIPLFTTAQSAIQTGIFIRSGALNADAARIYVANGSGTYSYQNESAAGSFDGPSVLVEAHDGTSQQTRNLGVQIDTQNILAATSAGDPTSQLLLGLLFGGTLFEVLAYNRKLTVEEIEQVEVYLSERWGISF